MARTRDLVAWALAGTILCTLLAWGNLTWLGIGRHQLLYDDAALPRLAVAVTGGVAAWLVFWISVARRGSTGTEEGRGPRVLRADITWALLGGLALWAVVSAFSSEQGPTVWLGQSERLEGVVAITLYALLFGAGLQVGRNARRLWRMAAALVIGSSVLAAYGVTQMLGLDPVDHAISGYGFDLRHAFASVGNPNFLGGVLALALPVAVACALTARGRLLRTLTGSCAALIALALFGSASQGAWLAVMVELVLAAAWYLYATRPAGRMGSRVAVVVACAAVAGLLLAWGVMVSNESADVVAGSGTRRVALVKVAVAAALERPAVGGGPDTYLVAFRAHAPQEVRRVGGQEDTAGNAHSWIPQYAATLGIPGALLLAFVLAALLWRGRPPVDIGALPEAAQLHLGVWLGLVGLIVHLQGSVAVPAATTPFWILAGALSAPRAREVPVGARTAIAAAGVSAVLLAVVALGSVRALEADAVYLRSRLVYNGAEQGDAAELAERAARLNPLSVKYARGAAQAHAAAAFGAGAQGDERRSAVEVHKARERYEAVLERWPGDYAARAWLAGLTAWEGSRASAPAGRLDDAQRIAKEAALVDALNVDLRRLANGDFSQGAIDAALAVPAIP